MRSIVEAFHTSLLSVGWITFLCVLTAVLMGMIHVFWPAVRVFFASLFRPRPEPPVIVLDTGRHVRRLALLLLGALLAGTAANMAFAADLTTVPAVDWPATLGAIWNASWPVIAGICTIASLISALPQPAPGSHWLPLRHLISFLAVNVGGASSGTQPPFSTWVARVLAPLIEAQVAARPAPVVLMPAAAPVAQPIAAALEPAPAAQAGFGRLGMMAAIVVAGLALAACANTDMAQRVATTDASYHAATPTVVAAIESGKLSAAEVTGVKTASQQVHDALGQASAGIAACPQVAGVTDAGCANGSVISAAWSAASTALAQIIATLTGHQIAVPPPAS